MKQHPHRPAGRPTHLASALMLWLAAVLSFGGFQAAVPDLGASRQTSSDAMRPGETPVQRSTAPSLHTRLILVAENAIEATSGSGSEGQPPAILAGQALDIAAPRAAHGMERPARSFPSPRIPGFQARAPPILA